MCLFPYLFIVVFNIGLRWFQRKIPVRMVACSLGNPCIDNLSPAQIICIGCKTTHHPVCLGVPRMAPHHIDHILMIFKHVCSKYDGMTMLDFISEQKRTSEKLDELSGKTGRRDKEFSQRLELFFATVDESSSLLESLRTFVTSLTSLQKDISSLQSFLSTSLINSASSVEENLANWNYSTTL